MFQKTFATSIIAALSLASLVDRACATPLLFNFTGDIAVSFVLDSNPAPAGGENFGGDAASFYVTNYPIEEEGVSGTTPYLEFYNSDAGGGVSASTDPGANGGVFFDFYGPQIFADSVGDPTFSVGSFELLEQGVDVSTETLAITPVPLPASAPMFGAAILALGAVGYGLRRKGKATA